MQISLIIVYQKQTKEKTMKISKLTKRFNKDGSITLYASGRKVFKSSDSERVNNFIEGWYTIQ